MAVICALASAACALPPSAGAQVTREGVLRETISDDFARHESATAYSVRAGGEVTPVLPTSPVSATSGDRVAVTGSMHEGELVGSLTKVQDLTPEAELVAPRKVAVLLMRFSGDPAQPWPLAQTREEVFTGQKSANAFFQEETYGKIALTGKLSSEGDVFGWFTLSAPTAGCDTEAWNAEARKAAEDAGVSLAGYEHIVYVSTFQASCSWLGLATLGGGTANINGTLGGPHVIAHELGHNLVLRHAGSWSCTKGGVRVSISNSCVTSEYGDVFDVMGNVGMRHSNAWNLRRLGVISLAENIETVSSDGTYTLQAALNPVPEPQVLRIARADSPPGGALSWYYLEIRQMGGLFENLDDATMDGVSIRATAEGSAADTLLIDCNPATTTFSDAPLPVGHTFSDGNVHVTVLSAGGGAASVSVGFGAFTDSAAPTAPSAPSASQDSTGVRLQWSPSEDNVAVTRYVVFRDGSEIGTAPSAAFTDASATVGLHAYVVYAEDEAGNRSPGSAAKVVNVVDMTAPTAPANLSASQDSTGVRLQWSPSEDNVGVSRYVVFRDGLEIGVSATTAYADLGPSSGRHAYSVYAEDQAGNRSPESAPTAVDVAGPAGPGAPTVPGVPHHAVTIRLEGGGSGSVGDGTGAIACPPTCAHSYAEGTQVTLTGTPAPGSKFAGWVGAGCAGTGPCQLMVGTDRALTATFVKGPSAPARLRIGRVRPQAVRSKLEVAVGGTIAGRARGVVAVDVSVRFGGRRVSATKSARIVRGRWHALLRLPGSVLAREARVAVAARFEGSPGVRAGHAARHVGP